MTSVAHDQNASVRLQEQCIFRSSLIDIGVFRASAESDLFGTQAPPGHFAVTFPETSVQIRPTHAPAFVTDRNVVCLYEPDDVYERTLVDPQGDRCTFIGPAVSVALEFAARAELTLGDGRLFQRAYELCPAATFRRHRRLVQRLLQDEPLPTALVEEEALGVLEGVARNSSARQQEGGDLTAGARRCAQRAREYLAAHYARAPTLAEIAEAAGCSPYHLSRIFRRHYRTTLHRYRTDLAVRDAYDQILETDRRLLDVALDLGFASHSHFTAAFRQVFGVLPSSLRQRTASHGRLAPPSALRARRARFL